MSITMMLRDESVEGKTMREWSLDFLTERITVRELIRSRVYQEVQDYNTRQPEVFQGLIQPTDAERTLNGFRMKERRQIDWKPQYEKACEAFETGHVLILLGDHQCEALEEEIEVKAHAVVSFLKLTPLVGG